MNELVLTVVLIGIGNCIGDFFGNRALAIQGEDVMATMACYSGQIFNLFFGFTLALFYSLQNGFREFELFDFSGFSEDSSINVTQFSKRFILFLIGFDFFILTMTLLYYVNNSFILKRTFGFFLSLVYVSFLFLAFLMTFLY